MDIKEFFLFGSKLVSSTVLASAIDLKKDENGIDDEWNLIKGNYKNIHFPIIFKQEDGKKFTDILDTGWPSFYLISDRLKSILEENFIIGWQTFPITLYDKKGNEISGYHGFSIIGRCSRPYYDNCEIVEKKMIPNGPICRFYKGMSIDSWDGTDFFTPEKTGHIFITKKTADILKKNKITNLRLENLGDSEMDVSNIKK